jgi:adenylate cyclase
VPSVFISYARSTEAQAQLLAKALRGEGFEVWFDESLPAHRPYADVIQEHLREAKAVVVIWSENAVKSQWVRAEADFARIAGSLVQVAVDGSVPPLPFNQIHCAQLAAWEGDPDACGWRNVLASIRELMSGTQRQIAPSGSVLPEKPSITVLPFSNLSHNPEHDYFVEGMMDEVVMALSRVRTLFVISSDSSRALKDKGWNAQQTAARLGTRYVLEGSVKWSGARVRVAVKLIDSSVNAQIWAERFEDVLEDMFDLQDRIALKIAGVIEPSVHEAEVRRVARQPIESLGCYDLYLRAAPLRTACRKDQVAHALELLERALALDPNFAPALAQAAGCHSQMYINRWGADRDWHKAQGLSLAERGLVNGAEDASVLAQVANAVMEFDKDVKRAASLARRATTINPGCSRAWFVRGVVSLYEKEFEAAIEQFQTAAAFDPISPLNDIIRAHLGVAHGLNGEYAEALDIIRTTTHRTARIHISLAAIYGYLNMPDQAADEFDRFNAISTMSVEDFYATGNPEIVNWFRAGLARAMLEHVS